MAEADRVVAQLLKQGAGGGRPALPQAALPPTALTGKQPGVFALKPVAAMLADADADDDPHAGGHLQRTLGLRNLVGFGVGSAVGVSLFVQTGPEAALHAGPAVALSFVLASLACLLAALCYAEFASLVPVAGSAYSYA